MIGSRPQRRAGRPFELRSSQLGALPIVDRFLARIDVAGMLERHLPAGDARATLPAATGDRRAGAQPVRGARAALRAGRAGPPRSTRALLGLRPARRELLNDDRVGRALDQLFDAIARSLLTELVLARDRASSASTARSCTTTRRRSRCTATTAARTATSGAASRPRPRRAAIPRTTAPISSSWC